MTRIALDGVGPVAPQQGPFVFWTLRNDAATAATFLLDSIPHTLDAAQVLTSSDTLDILERFEFTGTTDYRFFAVFLFA